MRIFKGAIRAARGERRVLWALRPAVRAASGRAARQTMRRNYTVIVQPLPSAGAQIVSDDSDDDIRVFREAMRGVRRLGGGRAPRLARPRPPARARFTRSDQREVLRESLLPPSDEFVLDSGDELNFRRPHIPPPVLLKLRRGQYSVEAEIDLHGMTGAEARNALRAFI